MFVGLCSVLDMRSDWPIVRGREMEEFILHRGRRRSSGRDLLLILSWPFFILVLLFFDAILGM